MRYSKKRSILQLVALLQAHGISEVVVCPGSRNAPIAQSLATDPFFKTYSVTDERSAGYVAIGMALQKRRAVAVCCTSGSAVYNLHPAVSEAFYQEVSLVVITADRPRAWIGQMDGQTVCQPSAFGQECRLAVDLPEVMDAESDWFCNRLINEALLAVNDRVKGPVHINIPLSEPLFEFDCNELPKVRKIERVSEHELHSFFERLKDFDRKMIIGGQSLPPDEPIRLPIIRKNFVLLNEQLANGVSTDHRHLPFDALLYATPREKRGDLAPDLLITFGGHLVSKRVKQWLRAHPPREHWHVSGDGAIVDLFQCLTHAVACAPCSFLKALEHYDGDAGENLFVHQWNTFSERLVACDVPFSSLGAMKKLAESLPQESVLHLANSSTVRLASLYPLTKGVEVQCNRGVNGIDGSLSSAIGYATASERANYLVIGDLSFFYDMNVLGSGLVGDNMHILLLNNGGGGIFNSLPGLEADSDGHPLITASHRQSAKGWTESCGIAYQRATNEGELCAGIKWLHGHGPRLLEVITDKASDAEVYKDYYHKLKSYEYKEKLD